MQNNRYNYNKKNIDTLMKLKKRLTIFFSIEEKRYKKEIKLEEIRKEIITQKFILNAKKNIA